MRSRNLDVRIRWWSSAMSVSGAATSGREMPAESPAPPRGITCDRSSTQAECPPPACGSHEVIVRERRRPSTLVPR